jgi:hypothetical protein
LVQEGNLQFLRFRPFRVDLKNAVNEVLPQVFILSKEKIVKGILDKLDGLRNIATRKTST